MSTLIKQVMDLYDYVAEDKKIALHSKSSDDLFMTADPGRVRQALANLLDNALKYTEKGGTVELEANRIGQRAVITVRDTGTGIPKEALPRIWDRLYRSDQSRSQRGLGLGLSLVKAIVQAHKGEIHVRSEPGSGSTFSISFPAAEKEGSPIKRHRSREKSSLLQEDLIFLLYGVY